MMGVIDSEGIRISANKIQTEKNSAFNTMRIKLCQTKPVNSLNFLTN